MWKAIVEDEPTYSWLYVILAFAFFGLAPFVQ